jgi:UDP-glucose 4-epimerase
MGRRRGPSMKTGQVFLTGATGFIGSHVCRALLAAGLKIVAMVHLSLPEMDGVITVTGTVDDLTLVRESLAQCDAVLHLAAFIPPDLKHSGYAEECFRTNSLLTLRLAECVLATRPIPFIYLSSGQGYAYSPGSVGEIAPVYPAPRAPYYLGSKLLGEIYVEHLRCARGLPAFCLRAGSVYGVGMPDNSVVARFMRAACAGGTLDVADGGSATADFVSASDVVWLALAAARQGKPGVYNVGSGVASSILDLARAVADVFPDRQPRIRIQAPDAAASVSFPALDITKANQEWGYSPRTLSEGLAQYRAAMEQP